MVLKGSKISLRDWKESDFNWYKIALQDNNRWLLSEAPWSVSRYNYKFDFENIEKEINISFDEKVRTNLIICNKDDSPVGFVNRYWRSKETNWLRIGIRIIDQNNWGKGYGKEAMCMWVGYLFDQMLTLDSIGLTTWSGNASIVRIADHLGMKLEARFRKVRSFNNMEYDALGFAVLRQEWIKINHR